MLYQCGEEPPPAPAKKPISASSALVTGGAAQQRIVLPPPPAPSVKVLGFSEDGSLRHQAHSPSFDGASSLPIELLTASR
eukprot:1563593-Prymnesium_polylepis.1